MSAIAKPVHSNSVLEAVHAAEVFTDVLEGLVEETIENPGAAFNPDVLQRLVDLKKENHAAFETLRAKLKSAGCRVTALDRAMRDASGIQGRSSTHADTLIEILEAAELFHSADRKAYGDLIVNGHRETWPVRSQGFGRWLRQQYFEETGGAPSSDALQTALSLAEARAQFGGSERQVFIRVGDFEGKLYLDLCDEAWRAVEVDAQGWRLVGNPPVRFRRPSGMRPLASPQQGGNIGALKTFLNVKTDQDFVLVVSWALAVLRNRGPYPVLVLSGEQGSAKSTFCAILRALLDPNAASLRALPREDRDLFIAATNAHVLAFDNISTLPAWISDTLCRLATGGGFAVRQLFTDGDEVLFDAVKPIILNGIEDIVTRPDLADRALFLTLEPIAETHRRPEAELWAAFEAERPKLLGVLLDAVVVGLRQLPETTLPKLPRMADFALWGTACETALWPSGTFWSAYNANRDDAIDVVIDADVVAAALRGFMSGRTEWTGTASDLLAALTNFSEDHVTLSKSWPDSPRGLSGRLRRAATFLRQVGITFDFDRSGKDRTRLIHIRQSYALATSLLTDEPSASSASPQTTPTAAANAMADGADANPHHQSGCVLDLHLNRDKSEGG